MMLKITDLINEQLVITDMGKCTKTECLEQMAERLAADGRVSDKALYLTAVMDREALGPTGIGMQVAIPHGKSDAVVKPSLVLAKSSGGIDFGAPDSTTAALIFLIAVPDTTDNLHLKILANLARSLMHEKFRNELLACDDKNRLLTILEGGILL